MQSKGKQAGAKITIKVTSAHIFVLTDCYKALLSLHVAENAHEQLLLVCAAPFYNKIKELDKPQTAKVNLQLTELEAVAFLQLWASQPMQLPPYCAVMVSAVMGKIDNKMQAKHKHIKRIYG